MQIYEKARQFSVWGLCGLVLVYILVSASSCNPLGVDKSFGGGDTPLAEGGPFISRVIPELGDTAGGTHLVIKGKNFVNGITAYINSVECSSITFVSALEIQCVSPAGGLGKVNVSVKNPNGDTNTLTEGYEYVLTILSITGPNGGVDFETDEPLQTVYGTCSKNVVGLVSSLGTFTDSDCSDGNWALDAYTLSPGANIFNISGGTLDGEASASDSITIDYDNIPPSLLITAPNNGFTYTTATQLQTVSGTCTTDVVNLATTLGTFMDDDCSDGIWSLNAYSLSAGANVFTISGVDNLGHPLSDSQTINYDSLAPSVSITAPNGGVDFVTNVLTQLVSGTCSTDVTSMTTTLGSFFDDDCSDGTWSLNEFVLSSGANIFDITAYDVAGNFATSAMTATYDNIAPSAPAVSGTSPTTDKTPTWSWITGGGGNGTYRYKLDDSDLSVGATVTVLTSYTPAVDLTVGAHTLYVQERDDAGNWSSSGSKAIEIEDCRPVVAWGRNNSGQLGNNATLPYRTTPVDGPALTGITKITGGTAFSVALKNDGTIWAWGLNDSGQLGDGTLGSRWDHQQVTGLSNVSDIAVGTSFTMALKTNGTVWGWGSNNRGQMGDGTTTNSLLPTQTLGTGGSGVLTNITKIDAGAEFVIALKDDGTVWSWGYNTNGQLGDNSVTQRTTPVQVVGPGGVGFLTDVVDISAGSVHTLAVKSDGSVWAWGLQTNGRLGNNQSVAANITTPTQVLGPGGVGFLTDVIAVSAGAAHSLALKSDGTVWAWGLNTNGQLGDNSVVQKLTPVQTDTVTNITKISAGTSYSSAIKNDGTLWMWGLNTGYRLGDGTVTQRNQPVQLAGITDAFQIKASVSHTMMATTGGTIKIWGLNSNGELGIEQINQLTPGAVYDFTATDVLDVATGAAHSLLIRTSDSTGWSFGLNGNGQLGDNTTVQKNAPVQVKGTGGVGFLTDLATVAAGASHSLASKTDGTAWAWGLNTNGRLGDNTVTQRNAPVQVKGTGGVGVLTDVAIVRAGSATSYALKTDGTVWAWGLGTSGQLGDNTIVSKSAPVQVVGPGGVGFLTDITAIAAGASHALALKSDGTVWSWGLNTNGRLGDGTTTTRSAPVQVMNLSNIVAISAGFAHSLAVDGNGDVWAWGLNTSYQLGDGTVTQRNQPVKLSAINGVIRVSGGTAHSYAIKSDGTVWAWGSTNNYGQLGDGTAGLLRITPVQVSGIDHVIKMDAGDNHGVARINCSY